MSTTTIFVVGSLFIFFGMWLVYDLMAAFVWKPRGQGVSTITHDIQNASKRVIAIPFLSGLLLGLLLGHLFLQF